MLIKYFLIEKEENDRQTQLIEFLDGEMEKVKNKFLEKYSEKREDCDVIVQMLDNVKTEVVKRTNPPTETVFGILSDKDRSKEIRCYNAEEKGIYNIEDLVEYIKRREKEGYFLEDEFCEQTDIDEIYRMAKQEKVPFEDIKRNSPDFV